MVAYLSQDWLDLQRSLAADLPERPGASARITYVVTGAPDGEVRYHQTFTDGRLVESALGEDPEADVTFTQTYAVARATATAEVDSSTAFMQGKVKVVGSMGTVMALMPLTQSDEHVALLAALSAQTDY